MVDKKKTSQEISDEFTASLLEEVLAILPIDQIEKIEKVSSLASRFRNGEIEFPDDPQ